MYLFIDVFLSEWNTNNTFSDLFVVIIFISKYKENLMWIWANYNG